ncbi:hypothetical protein Tco_0382341 [Tanacetum coccineum]
MANAPCDEVGLRERDGFVWGYSRRGESDKGDEQGKLAGKLVLFNWVKVNDPTSGIRACVEQDIPPPTIITMKIPIIRKGEYDIWSMRMRQYICHTDHNLWDVIVNGDLEEEPAPTGETSAPSDVKSLWEASNSSLDKAYDRFQTLISQLEVHGAPILKEDINQKFLRSLPPSWNQIALIMRNKPEIDEIDIDDLYNNLRVYEDEMKRSSSSTSTSQNLAFLSSKNTSNTNEVSTTNGDFGVSTAGGISQVSSTPCAHDVACSFFIQPTTSPQLKNEDFQQINEDDLEELDLRWQVAMLTVRICKESREKSYGNNGRSNAPTNESSSQALVAQDGLGGYDWSNDFELNEMNNNSETDSEISLSVFDVRSSDEVNKPANDNFSKVDGFHVVPPPITGNFLTPRADISFAGKTNEANTQKPKTVYELVNRDKVIIEDWNSDDEDDVSEVQTISPVKTNETQIVQTRDDKIGQTSQKQGIGTQESYVAGSSGKDKEPIQEYILLPLHPHRPRIPVEDVIQDAQEKSSKNAPNDKEMAAQAVDDATRQAFEEEKRKSASTKRAAQTTSINKLNTDRASVNTANTPYVSVASTPTGANADESSFVYLGGQIPIDASTLPNADLPTDTNMPDLEDVSNAFPNDGIFSGAYDDDDVGAEADFNNMDNTIDVSPIPTLRVHKDYPKGQILGDPKSVVQTRGKIQKASLVQQALVSYIYNQNRTNHKDHQNSLFACFLSQEEPKNISQALQDESWVEAMQEELLPFKLQKVWVLVDLPYGKKYVADILKKFDFCSIKTATTPIESNKPLVKDEDGVDVDVHIYRSMIGSLMYLTASRLDIMFVVCACARFQVTPKASHLNAVKRIFRYLKHQPKLGLWYPRDSPFELEAFSDSDYGGASLDRKSTTGGCQFLGRRLISWQCKKQTIVANSTTEAEYVAAANCFKNPVYHSRTKHIEIRHHFIRDCYEKRLIDVVKIHTDNNVADLLTKGFDVTRFNFLVYNFLVDGLILFSGTALEFENGWNLYTVISLITELGYAGDYVPLLPAMLAGAAEDQADEATTTGVRVGTKGATTTTSGLDAGLDSGNIHESPLRSHEAPLYKGHTLGSAEDNLKLKELLVLVPKLVTRIANLEKELHQTKTTYGKAVLTLVERVKSLEVALKRKIKIVVLSDLEDEETKNQGRKIQDIDDDPLVSLVRESMKEKDIDFVTLTKISASGEVQEQDISPTTLESAKTLSHVISQKAKSTDKGIRYKRKTRSKSIEKDISTDLDADIEVNPGSEEFNTGNEDFNTGSLGVSTGSGPVSTPSVVQTINFAIPSLIKSQREGKAPMTIEEIQATKRTKAQIQQEEAGLAEAMRLEKLEANAELTKSLQGESMTSKDFTKKMVEMIKQKKKFYAKQKVKARRSKPMIQVQQRDYMSTFIKNQSSWKLTQLKKLTFDELKTKFEKLVKSIENFVPMETDETVKRQGVQLEQEFSKKQKTIEEVLVLEESLTEPVIAKEQKIEKSIKKRGKIMKQKARKGIHIDKTAQDETEEERETFIKDKVTDASSESEIEIDAIPTAIKPPSIIDWKIVPQLGQKVVYQIIRRDSSDKIYMSFGAILKDFSRDDLTKLYKLVIKKYGANRPEEMYDRQKMINWKYYSSCAVHCLTLDDTTIYMLADRKYPLSKDACQAMLKMKLLDGTMDEVCYQLLKMIEKQAGLR